MLIDSHRTALIIVNCMNCTFARNYFCNKIELNKAKFRFFHSAFDKW